MSQSKGKIAEDKACEILISQGFKIIERNFFAKKLGEIDIIATKDSIYHFVEVKSADDYETAVNNISPQKLSKIKRSVNYYIQNKKLNVNFCIDAIIVFENQQIEILENITF